MTEQSPRAMLVYRRRQAATVGALGIECDQYETPVGIRGETPVSWWLAERAGFAGWAQDESSGEMAEGAVGPYSTALAVANGCLLGIVAPDDLATASLWLSWPLSEIQLSTEGTKGVLRKRPALIAVEHEGSDSELNLSGISRLWRNSDRAQPWQERAFIEAVS